MYGGIAVIPRSSDNDFSTKKHVLELALLGPPEVRSDILLLAFRTQKALALLVYLAVTGTPQPRSHLAALLWPDREDAQARATLRSTLRLLREAIINSSGSASKRDVPRIHSRHAEAGEGLIRSARDRLGREALWLQEETVRLDLQVIEQAAALTTQGWDRRPANSPDYLDHLRLRLETAAERCRGPFLANFTLDDAPNCGLDRAAARLLAGPRRSRLKRAQCITAPARGIRCRHPDGQALDQGESTERGGIPLPHGIPGSCR